MAIYPWQTYSFANAANTWRLPKGNQPNLIEFWKAVVVSPEFAGMMQRSDSEDFYFSLLDDDFFTYVL
ncbi:hypothetical protein NQ314_009198 [Rhamnusium bicolor]|uniref:Uncharacterized protein n=1 Tax=Rhamnusium bicolor TaxID=1586634 RepID=A0AAV8Y4P9_9CUCU|nr:hypothetical protein NQ314_009198 [Rhamnusium bicolor]